MKARVCGRGLLMVGFAASVQWACSDEAGGGAMGGDPGASNGGTGGAAGSVGGTGGSGGVAGIGGTPPGSGGVASGGTGGGTAGATGGSSGSTTSTGGQPDPGTAPTAITNLMIEPNPNNVLSAFVSWTTDVPAHSEVEFGVGEYQWEIADPTLTTDHRVLVIGMHAEEDYLIRAISSNSAGSVSAEGSFTTASLPAVVPVGEVTAHDTARAQPGWTLMNVQVGNGTANARSNEPAMAVMYDGDGLPVWYHINGSSPDIGGAVSVDPTDRGVLFGPVGYGQSGGESPREVDLAGNVVWECDDVTCGGAGSLSHHAGKLPNGNYVIQRDVSAGGVTAPVFEELTPDLEVVWSVDLRDVLPAPPGASGDWCHGNSVTVDIPNNAVYMSCRWLGLIKTTYQNPSLVWHLPASYGAETLGDIAFVPESSQFSDIHDPEIHDDGTILFFDNGGWSGMVGENTNGYRSRVLEFQLDATTETATLVWEFPGTFTVDAWYTNEFYLPFWGDADRLENGNVLVTAGVRGPDARSRVFEVAKADGAVVWEFQLPPDFGTYRAERLSPPPLVRPVSP